jgi:hypothetical protein
MAFTKEQREAKKLAQLVENQGEKSEVVGEASVTEQETAEIETAETEQSQEQGTEQETAEIETAETEQSQEQGTEQETAEIETAETEQSQEQGTEQETTEEKPEYVAIKLNKVTALKLLGCVPNSLYVQGKNVMFDNLQATVHVDVQAYLAEQGLIEVD